MGLGALGTHYREVAAKLKGRVTDKEAWIGSGEKGLQARSLQEVTREAWERGRLGRKEKNKEKEKKENHY